jgi:hypothetical protein
MEKASRKSQRVVLTIKQKERLALKKAKLQHRATLRAAGVNPNKQLNL